MEGKRIGAQTIGERFELAGDGIDIQNASRNINKSKYLS